jgi:hypothetical protein
MYIIEDILTEGTTTPVDESEIKVLLSTTQAELASWRDATLTADDTTRRYTITNGNDDIVWVSGYEETALRHLYEAVDEPEP